MGLHAYLYVQSETKHVYYWKNNQTLNLDMCCKGTPTDNGVKTYLTSDDLDEIRPHFVGEEGKRCLRKIQEAFKKGLSVWYQGLW